MTERLQKLLSQWGIASRRQAEQLIREKRVTVNGAIANLGQSADPSVDLVQVDGVALATIGRPESAYFLLHKPLGVVSTCQDPQGRTTVLDCLAAEWRQGQGLHPVGRLDTDSTGALLLTNDGELTHQLTHPRHHIAKTYQVTVKGYPTQASLRQWCRGIVLSGQKTLPAKVRVLQQPSPHQTLLEVTLWEGRNRQIRRTAEALGHPVTQLHRVAIGPLRLARLPVGQYRCLQPSEIEALKRATSCPY
ncbi:rRNA pseudouridine synthase [Romeria aff. gracilis LEGE 07310]|uniref:Pseudouridine synthase n=1 Tax=Vasconcelosia minhoensis LEGE 07310 TaxID=915328 RepID=A0A8J7A7R4_9CYAN|nr:pseudouridine synthase [Romeria gracilis]MBE9078557.1 rRNA pseudouridine synthase [Romeria aff. gracilis LEGE 07310]